MNKPLIRAVLIFFLATTGAAFAGDPASDPVIGTWRLNASKSTFTAGPAIKSQTRTYSQTGQRISLVMKSTNADGKEMTSETTYQLDGKDYPVTGSPDFDSLSAQQVDPQTAKFTLKRGGKAIGTTTRTVSKDGKTLTTKMKLTSAGGGETDNVLVFDKQ
jgi:hypothetical protein